MKAIIILLTFVVAASAVGTFQDLYKKDAADYQCGGSGGNTFNDEPYAQYGAITGFEIWHGSTTCVMDGISLRYGSVWGPKHNNKGSNKAYVEFAAGETLTAIGMDKRTHWGYEVLCQVTIFTSVQVYGPYCNHDCSNSRCGSAQFGEFRYISGSFGANLDHLTWHL